MRFLGFALIIAFATTASFADPIQRSEIWVKDGDTIIKGDGATKHKADQEYRLVGFDTPETSPLRAKCPAEYEKGNRASARLVQLLDSGPIDLTEVRCSCTQSAIANGKCNWGRRCGRLAVSGKDVGDTLIAEGHAVSFHCSATRCPKQKSWC